MTWEGATPKTLRAKRSLTMGATLLGGDGQWFAVFFFEESGYVRDDEKLDADALLNSLKAGDQRGNEERKRLDMPPLHTEGWHVAPHYDLNTKRLEWGVRLR